MSEVAEVEEDPRESLVHKRLLTLVPLLVLVGLIAYGLTTRAPERAAPTELPDFSLPRIGEPGELTDEDLEGGKPVVLNFWASWCIPCRAEAPLLARAAREHADHVRFVGIAVMDSELGAEEFLDEYGIDFDNVLDLNADMARGFFTVLGLPQTYFVLPDGRLSGTVGNEGGGAELQGVEVLGPITEAQLDREIARLMGAQER